MAPAGDQPRQMLEWMKRVEKCGFTVEQNRLLYHIKDPETGRLILTAPMYPRGNQVLRDTIARAKKNGIDVEEMESKRKKLSTGQAPPPVSSPLPPEQARMAAEHEARVAQQRKEEAVVTPLETPKRVGRGPTTPEKYAATKAAVDLVRRALNLMGGDTYANRMSLWESGCELARKQGRRWIGEKAQSPKDAARVHMDGLLGDKPMGAYAWVDEFWTLTARAMIAKMASQEGVGETTAEEPLRKDKDDDVVVGEIQETETVYALRQSLEAVEADLADEREAHRQTTEQLRMARNELADVRRELEQEKATHNGNGHATASVADEVSIVVLRRMLLKDFPDGEAAIDEAIDFAAEVVRRVS